MGVAESAFLDIPAVGREVGREGGRPGAFHSALTVCPAHICLVRFCDPTKGLGAGEGPPGPPVQGKGQFSLMKKQKADC